MYSTATRGQKCQKKFSFFHLIFGGWVEGLGWWCIATARKGQMDRMERVREGGEVLSVIERNSSFLSKQIQFGPGVRSMNMII